MRYCHRLHFVGLGVLHLYCNRHDLVFEFACPDSGIGFLVGFNRELILLAARNVVSLRNIFRGLLLSITINVLNIKKILFTYLTHVHIAARSRRMLNSDRIQATVPSHGIDRHGLYSSCNTNVVVTSLHKK